MVRQPVRNNWKGIRVELVTVIAHFVSFRVFQARTAACSDPLDI
jgi:hypothetical protein